jgi:hypothetical protein
MTKKDSIIDDFDDMRKDDVAVKKFDIFEKKNEELTRNLQNIINDLKSSRARNDLKSC